MKIRKKSRLISLLALLLATVMMLALLGCGDDSLKSDYQEDSTISSDPSDEGTEDGKEMLTTGTGEDTWKPTITIDPDDSDLDFSELYEQLALMESITPSLYTPESWEKLEEAWAMAQNIADAETQMEVDLMVALLQSALDGLEKRSSTTTSTTGGVSAADPVKPSEMTNAKPSAVPSATATARPTTTARPTSTKTTTKPTTTKPTTVLDQAPSSLSGTKIKMLIWWTSGTDDQKEAAEFKDKTGIQVAYETATMDKYQSNLSGKIMAGNPPALAAIINEWYPQPITRGLMQPIKNTGWDYSDPIYATAMMDQFSYKGERYGVALKGSNMTTFEVMFYNKKLLKNNGVTKDPYQLWKDGQWNWDTCLEIAQKCTNAKKDKYGMTLIYQNYWMLSAGQDFVLSDKNGLKNNIKSSDLLNAWYTAWDMIYTHKVIPTMFSTQQTLFFTESVAMLGGGSYFMQSESSHTNYVPQNCDFEWDVVPFPSPKGKVAVAACEGTVWGFPTKVKGNQLQAAMWFLRYYLDDSTYSDRDIYPDDELGTHCWEVIGWMWNQKIQSFNSVGVVTYGGKHSAASIQYSLIDEATTKAQVKSNLDGWYAEIQVNIDAINSGAS